MIDPTVYGGVMMRVDEIHVIDRHRRDLGNLDSLRDSIAARGLLHPVVVASDGRLVAGERRLAACVQLGWTEVPVTVADSLDSVADLLAAERDENTERLDMAPSEKVALGRALEELKGIGDRGQGARTDLTSEKFSEVRKGRTAEIVGEAVGMSRPTYDRAKTVVEKAEAGDPVAVEALAEMDRTGKVTPAYEKVTGRPTEGRKIRELQEVPRQPNPIKQRRMPPARNVVPRVIAGLRVHLAELDRALHEGVVEREEAAAWHSDLYAIRTSLSESISHLKEHC